MIEKERVAGAGTLRTFGSRPGTSPFALGIRDPNRGDSFTRVARIIRRLRARFSVPTEFLSGHEIHTVGDSHRREYWIPAADLPRFNANIAGPIEISQSSATDLQPDLRLGVSAEECQIRRIVRGQVFVRGANLPDKFDNSAGSARRRALIVIYLDSAQDLTKRERRRPHLAMILRGEEVERRINS